MRYIYLLLLLSPLPFASARPVWQLFWVIFIGIAGLLYAVKWKSISSVRIAKSVWIPVIGVTLFSLWGLLQIALGTTVNNEKTLINSLYYLAHCVWFVLIYKSLRSRADVPKLVLIIAAIAILYTTYGLITYFTGNKTILWYDKPSYWNSLTSTFVNRNSFAAFCGIGLQCLLAHTLWTYSGQQSSAYSLKEKFILFLEHDLTQVTFTILSFVVLLSGLFLTGSRAGITTALLSSFLLLLFGMKTEEESPNLVSKRFIGVCLSLLIVGTIFGLSGGFFQQRLESFDEQNQRFEAYPIEIDAIADNPLTGYGLGTFQEVFAQFRTETIKVVFDRGHNDYLELAMTAGVIPATVFLISIGYVIVNLLLHLRKKTQYRVFIVLGLTVIFQLTLHSFVDFSLQMPAVSYVFTAILAFTTFLSNRVAQQTKPIK